MMENSQSPEMGSKSVEMGSILLLVAMTGASSSQHMRAREPSFTRANGQVLGCLQISVVEDLVILVDHISAFPTSRFQGQWFKVQNHRSVPALNLLLRHRHRPRHPQQVSAA
jgi:hypothetical protein